MEIKALLLQILKRGGRKVAPFGDPVDLRVAGTDLLVQGGLFLERLLHVRVQFLKRVAREDLFRALLLGIGIFPKRHGRTRQRLEPFRDVPLRALLFRKM